ncbi:hypothetical protein Atai01_08300 [Amycolatopsis taiwanensis]|uniref:Uncharacterized protein n=1 Tax=Amycolatopsis taiwanensis TaxID=342230 RepID=A0A9W6QUD3_9PSEU|nr:hypothetical protein Atai01_08300 [Amycolatopsis taiwanensis]
MLYLAITYGILVMILALTGRLDAFAQWQVYPGLISGSLLGNRFYQRREAVRRDADKDANGEG